MKLRYREKEKKEEEEKKEEGDREGDRERCCPANFASRVLEVRRSRAVCMTRWAPLGCEGVSCVCLVRSLSRWKAHALFRDFCYLRLFLVVIGSALQLGSGARARGARACAWLSATLPVSLVRLL